MGRSRAVLTLAVSLGAVAGCSPLLRLIGRPRVEAVRPRVAAIDFAGVDLQLNLDVRNPYPVRLKAPLVRWGLDIQGSEFLKSETPVNVDLPAREVATVSLPVRLTYGKLLGAYLSLRELPEVAYRVRGVLRCSALGTSFELPFSREDKVPVLRPPRFSEVRVRLSNVSLRSVMVSVEAKATNPNAFPVDIRNLGYLLKVGDAQIGGLIASTDDLIPAGGTGRVTLSGHLSAASVLARVLRGESLRRARLCPFGSLLTPYGTAKLDEHGL